MRILMDSCLFHLRHNAHTSWTQLSINVTTDKQLWFLLLMLLTRTAEPNDTQQSDMEKCQRSKLLCIFKLRLLWNDNKLRFQWPNRPLI